MQGGSDYAELRVKDADNALSFHYGGAERMRIDSSGNLLVGTTNVNNNADDGIRLKSDGTLQVRSDNSGFVATLNRSNASDGDILTFAKSNSTVGSIGVASSAIHLGNQDTGIRFAGGADAIQPWNTGTNAARDGAIDLGTSSARFKDLYLGGGVVETTTTVTYASSIALTYNNGSIQTVTLTGNVTFTDSLADGESIVLMLNAGASYTVTFPTMTWVSSCGNAAPTLTANDTLVFWKIGSTLYGAYAGSYT